MSDLEDDVLMQLIESAKTITYHKERADLLGQVWVALDRLLKKMVHTPGVSALFQEDLANLHGAVAAVLAFDAEHTNGPDA